VVRLARILLGRSEDQLLTRHRDEMTEIINRTWPSS